MAGDRTAESLESGEVLAGPGTFPRCWCQGHVAWQRIELTEPLAVFSGVPPGRCTLAITYEAPQPFGRSVKSVFVTRHLEVNGARGDEHLVVTLTDEDLDRMRQPSRGQGSF